MGYWILRDNRREYAVDWDVVYRIIRAFSFARYRLSDYTVESTDDGFGSPLMHHYVFDWDAIRRKSIAKADEDFARISERATSNMIDAREELRWMVEGTQRLTEDFANRMRAQQVQNLQSMQSTTRWLELETDALRFIRDLSADFIVVSSSLMTGGAAAAGVAALGAGSALKGAYKYQDTESVASALMTGSGSLLFGALKLNGFGKTAIGEKLLVIVGQSAVDAGSAWAAGKPAWDIVKAGAAKGFTSGVSEFGLSRLLQMRIFERLISNSALRTNIEYLTSMVKVPDEVKAELIHKTTKKLLESSGKKVLERPVKLVAELGVGAARDLLDPPKAEPRRNDTLLASTTLQDDLLLTLAIIDMQEGLGWRTPARSGYSSTAR